MSWKNAWFSFKKRNPVYHNKKYAEMLKKDEHMGKNIYNDSTTKKHIKKFNMFHYVFKYKILHFLEINTKL